MGIYYFPCEFVCWKKNKKHSEMKDYLMKEISKDESLHKNNTQGVNNGFTSYGKSQNFLKDPKLLEHIVMKPFQEMIDEFNARNNVDQLNIKCCAVQDAWYTKYDVGGNFPFHTHNEGECCDNDNMIFYRSFSAIYILNDTSKKNVTEFFLPNMCKTSAFSKSDFRFNTGDQPGIDEGSVIIFPSSLYHQVLPVLEPGRITISYNLICSYSGEPKRYQLVD